MWDWLRNTRNIRFPYRGLDFVPEPVVSLEVSVEDARPWPVQLLDSTLGNKLYELLVLSGEETKIHREAVYDLAGVHTLYTDGSLRKEYRPEIPVAAATLDLNEVRPESAHLHGSPVGMLIWNGFRLSEFDVERLQSYAQQVKNA